MRYAGVTGTTGGGGGGAASVAGPGRTRAFGTQDASADIRSRATTVLRFMQPPLSAGTNPFQAIIRFPGWPVSAGPRQPAPVAEQRQSRALPRFKRIQ